ncbi:hypothetical protein CR513_48358, partial [Mucuna pruriens]
NNLFPSNLLLIPHDKKEAYKKREDDVLDIGYFMLATMNHEFQKLHENLKMGQELAANLIIQSLSNNYS